MVFGLFSKERQLQRAIKKATNKLSQQPERWAALEKLRDEGSDESLYHVLRRFSFSSLKSVEDQQEKEWVVQTMIGLGVKCLPAMRRYFKTNSAIAYPLKILSSIGDHETRLEVIDEILAVEEPGYTRDPDKRIQVIEWLAEYRDADSAEIVDRVVPYLVDFDENVRFKTVEAISVHPLDTAGEPLAAAMVNPDEESGRLKARIAEVLAEHEMPVGEHKKAVSAMLDGELEGFRLHRDRLARKIKPKRK